MSTLVLRVLLNVKCAFGTPEFTETCLRKDVVAGLSLAYVWLFFGCVPLFQSQLDCPHLMLWCSEKCLYISFSFLFFKSYMGQGIINTHNKPYLNLTPVDTSYLLLSHSAWLFGLLGLSFYLFNTPLLRMCWPLKPPPAAANRNIVISIKIWSKKWPKNSKETKGPTTKVFLKQISECPLT